MKDRISLWLGVALVSAVVTYGTYKMIDQPAAPLEEYSEAFDQANYQPVAYTSRAANVPDFTEAAERSVHAVVHIRSKVVVAAQQQQQYVDPFEFFFGGSPRGRQQPQQPRVQEGMGSGVIIAADGYIMTNNHVIDGADEIIVTLNDNRTFDAKLVGTDPSTDIALLKIEAKALPFIPFGSSDDLKVGEWVLAVGNPFNLTSTVTAGIVSAKGRGNVFGARQGQEMKIESFIQTDAAVNPGNSGGALVNTAGELIGINTAIYSETGNYAGYSFAVPVSIAAKVAKDLKEFGEVQRAILGISIVNVTAELAVKEGLDVIEGVYVGAFADRSSAKEAGVERGDVITAVDGTKVKNVSELQDQISRHRPGEKVTLTIKRGKDEEKITVELRNMQGGTAVVKDAGLEVLGAAFKPVSDDMMRKYGISNGVVVTGVSDGKFEEVGIEKGYIILQINNYRVSSADDIEKVIEQITKGRSDDQGLFIKGFYPNGKTRYYAIDLASE